MSRSTGIESESVSAHEDFPLSTYCFADVNDATLLEFAEKFRKIFRFESARL